MEYIHIATHENNSYNFRMKIHEVINERIKSLKLIRARVAVQAGIDKGQFYNQLLGKVGFTVANLEKLSNILGLKLLADSQTDKDVGFSTQQQIKTFEIPALDKTECAEIVSVLVDLQKLDRETRQHFLEAIRLLLDDAIIKTERKNEKESFSKNIKPDVHIKNRRRNG